MPYLLIDGLWVLGFAALVDAARWRHSMVGRIEPVLVPLVATAVELEKIAFLI
jgi:hypothetical protein